MDSNITIFDEKYVISPTCTKTEPNFKNYDDNYLNNIISKNNDRNKRTKKLINLCSDNGYCIHINKEFNNKSIYLNVPQIEFNREPIRTNNDSDFLSLKYMTKRIQRNVSILLFLQLLIKFFIILVINYMPSSRDIYY